MTRGYRRVLPLHVTAYLYVSVLPIAIANLERRIDDPAQRFTYYDFMYYRSICIGGLDDFFAHANARRRSVY